MTRHTRPNDVNRLVKFITDTATGITEDKENVDAGKNFAAVALGRLGVKIGD